MSVRTMFSALATVSLFVAAPAIGAPCKDAKGKFIKCPTPKPATARCKLNGKFAKCGTPGAKPM